MNTANPANTARAYTLRAATDLHGDCSTEYKAVQAAWTAVNVAGSDAPCTGNPANDFTVTVAPSSGSVTAGASLTATVSTTTSSGSAQTVAFTGSGLPAGATASFSPSSVTSGAASTLTITTAASTPGGTYTVTITGTGTSATHTATFELTVTGTPGTCGSPGQKLGNPGFETGTAPWTGSTGTIGSFSGQPAHGGTRISYLNGYGYSSSENIAQSVSLPAGCTTYTFSFWLHIDSTETTGTVAYDTLRVQVLNSSGTVLATLATYSNLNKAAGYTQRSFSLAAYAGQTVSVKFLGTEDASLQTSFVIDDTAITVS
ncbi:hypothetical protein GCM10010399_76020 [Dactylosporangium fulvum]